MKTQACFIGLVLLVLCGCENVKESAPLAEKVTLLPESAVIEAPETNLTKRDIPLIENEDIPIPVFSVALADVTRKSQHTSDSLTVTLTNSGKEDLLVTVNLNCSGFGVLHQSAALGEYLVKAEKIRTLKVDVKELPIQSDANALQIHAEASFKSAERKDDDWSMIVSPVYHYIFNAEYSQAKLMTSDVMMAEHKGKLLDITDARAKGRNQLGKVKSADGKIEVLTTESEAFAFVHEGRVLGYLISETVETSDSLPATEEVKR
ncbi:MAG: hypothetical protein M0R76_05680 [Proteobacteria bacterium]|nr:hypothetical protein [Pseudomonadota bacterium]